MQAGVATTRHSRASPSQTLSLGLGLALCIDHLRAVTKNVSLACEHKRTTHDLLLLSTQVLPAVCRLEAVKLIPVSPGECGLPPLDLTRSEGHDRAVRERESVGLAGEGLESDQPALSCRPIDRQDDLHGLACL
jgi:hypothetical protein